MSIQAMSQVMEHSTLRGGHYVVLLVIANHEGEWADGNLWAWPSIDRIAREARVSRRTAIDGIAAAERVGELLVERNAGPSGVNLYRILGGADSARSPEAQPVQSSAASLHPERKEPGFSSVVGLASSDSDVEPKARSARPTEDQTYLATRIADRWGLSPSRLGPAALQKLNSRYGVETVTGAMRALHGFPPEEAVDSPYAYLVAICEQEAAS